MNTALRTRTDFFNDSLLFGNILKDGFSNPRAFIESANFPFHNVIKETDDVYRIELAVAGYAESELQITTERGNLIVKGTKEAPEGEVEYLHRGITYRSFERSFTLGEHINVVGADLVNGILTVKLERVIPEEKRPRQIKIGS